MRSHKTNTFQSFNLLDFLKQLGKADWVFQILTIGIDILSKEHDFLHAICYVTLNLTDNILRFTASLTTTHIRDNTITAEIVAAKHDIDTCFERVLAFIRQILHNLIGIFPDIYHHFAGIQTCLNQLCQFKDIVCTENNIHMTVRFTNLVNNKGLLHHAAAQCDQHIRMALLSTLHLSQAAVNTKIGIFTYRTGIVNDKIRILRICFCITDAFQNARQFL